MKKTKRKKETILALIEEELEIVKLGEILNSNLKLPTYQRPYRWTKKTAVTLFQDVKQAYQKGKAEYRIGTVILHKNEEGIYNIVDGQQRLTTLCLLKYCLTGEEGTLFNQEYNSLSQEAITNNYKILKQKVIDLKQEEESYTKYLLENCTIVKLVIDSEQEAFQFFDSQNSRGKPLYPHDLLKSYHLREIAEQDKRQKEEELKKLEKARTEKEIEEDQRKEKEKLIEEWENLKEEELENLFANQLFSIIQWYRGKNGLYYSTKKIETFKGIQTESPYPYAKYYAVTEQFQLTQPVIAGRKFFEYVLQYHKLSREVEKILEERLPIKYKEFYHKKGSGYGYIKNLFINAAMLFADRFGKDSLTNDTLRILFQWAYSLRIVMQAVYQETMNNYAIGKDKIRINEGINMFEIISQMKRPEELELIALKTVEENKYKLDEERKKLYDCIYEEEGKEDE